MKNKRYFPLYVDLSDKNVVVVGGGTIATRRVKALLLFTRNITVIAPKMTADLWELGKLGTKGDLGDAAFQQAGGNLCAAQGTGGVR